MTAFENKEHDENLAILREFIKKISLNFDNSDYKAVRQATICLPDQAGSMIECELNSMCYHLDNDKHILAYEAFMDIRKSIEEFEATQV